MPKVSIVVPVYKVEKYLNRCIDSILSQSFSDFELILVNDGSPDNCGVICDEYAMKDDRIKVIHKENGGLSSARNAGIDIARGEYIGFVDSDDWIEHDMYELLYNNAQKYSADISMCKFKAEKDESIKMYLSPTSEEVIELTSEQAIQTMLDCKRFDLTQFACDKLYHLSLFESIRYPDGKLYEDIATTYKLIHTCNKFVYSPSTKYHYTENINSITLKKFGLNQLDIIDARSELYNFIAINYPKLIKSAKNQLISANISVIKKMVESNDIRLELYKNLRREICIYIFQYIKAPGIKKIQKIYALIIFLSPPQASFIMVSIFNIKNQINYSK